MTGPDRDHGGGLDAAIAAHGGDRADWIDLSTGINPVPYPVGDLPAEAWTALPDRDALARLVAAARSFWRVPEAAQVIAAPGASALIARMPLLAAGRGVAVHIPRPTYNEHAAAFAATGRHRLTDDPDAAAVRVLVHPNNPDGRLWPADAAAGPALTVIDESFCDVTPGHSHVGLAGRDGVLVLKSFGKFWGLAGLRLGFAIGRPGTLAPADGPSMAEALGPWAVAGPALEIGARALADRDWADAARARLAGDARRLDDLATRAGARVVGGTDLFRLYAVADAAAAQAHLARHRIWSRTFPYSAHWLRLGLPHPDGWDRVAAALGTAGGAMRAPAAAASGGPPA